jgi:hypothetical protein
MRKLVVLLVLAGLVGCTHLPQAGAKTPLTGAGAPTGATHWTDQQCESNAVAQDVWGGIALGGATLAGASGLSSVAWGSDEAQRAARIGAMATGAIGVVATLISNNLKNRGAEHCQMQPPPPGE